MCFFICFTNFSWTFDLSYQFSKKIKTKYPNTIVIFGGPNYPNEVFTQKSFLTYYPAIDFQSKEEAGRLRAPLSFEAARLPWRQLG